MSRGRGYFSVTDKITANIINTNPAAFYINQKGAEYDWLTLSFGFQSDGTAAFLPIYFRLYRDARSLNEFAWNTNYGKLLSAETGDFVGQLGIVYVIPWQDQACMTLEVLRNAATVTTVEFTALFTNDLIQSGGKGVIQGHLGQAPL